MKSSRDFKLSLYLPAILILHLLTCKTYAQKNLTIGIHADPSIAWFSSDISSVKNDGARPGFNFGLTVNKYFATNYSFSTGISLISAGGRLTDSGTTTLYLEKDGKEAVTVLPGKPVTYKIQYVSIPLGIKLETNQIGYLTFFTDLGFDPKLVVGGKVDVLTLENKKAPSELRTFNLSYHIAAGVEYGIGGNTAMVFGLCFDNNFLDITKDVFDQSEDKITHRIMSFRIGINF